jgi:hypothetical protein
MRGNTIYFRMRDSANGNRKKVVRMEAGEFIGRLSHLLVDSRFHSLTIPISAAFPVIQLNKVYPPSIRQRIGP